MAEALGNLGAPAMFYLAAAVADFYIPEENMVRQWTFFSLVTMTS